MIPGAVSTTTPAGGGTTSPVKTPFSIPARSARTISLRPTVKSVGSVVIAQDGTGDYTNFQDCFTDMENIRLDGMARVGKTVVDETTRIDVAVAPGHYTDPISAGIPQESAFFAMSATEQTKVSWGLSNSGPFYWEGIDVENVDNNGAFDPKYAFHLSAARATIITEATCSNIAPHAGGYPTPLGMDGTQGALAIFHSLNLTTGAYTNLHGWGLDKWDAAKPGMRLIFSDVSAPGLTLQYNASNDSTDDEMWVIDCTADSVKLIGNNTKLHVSGGTIGTLQHTDNSLNPIAGTDSDTSAAPWPTAA